MKIELDESRKVMDAAIDAGVNFFDTADMYGGTESESFIGEALQGRRNCVLIGTKVAGLALVGGGSKWGTQSAIVEACEASLSRLRTDTIDLYQMHYPDPGTPIEETLAALDELIASGKVRAIGCSNFTREMLEEAPSSDARGGRVFASLQNEWRLLNREAELEVVPACVANGVGFLPYFPLASGVLTGKYRRGAAFEAGSRLDTLDYFAHFGSDENLAVADQLAVFAEAAGHTLLELALGWLASHACVASIIAGASRPEQVTANAAGKGWTLSAEELARVDELTGPPRAA